MSDVNNLAALVAGLEALPLVRAGERKPSFGRIGGTRIVVIGADAQVGHVGLGAVSEADRHNIRRERISVHAIPLVGRS